MENLAGLIEIMKVPVLWTAIILCAGCGVIGMLSPKLLAKVNNLSTKWIDTNWIISSMDKKVDVDRYVVKHARTFSLLSIVAAAALLYRFT